MNNYLVKHIAGIFFTILLVFGSSMQGVAGYVDNQIKLEKKANSHSEKKDTKALFSQTSAEEENNQKNGSSKEMNEKIHYFHQINLLTFFGVENSTSSDFFIPNHYTSMFDGVMTPPPELI